MKYVLFAALTCFGLGTAMADMSTAPDGAVGFKCQFYSHHDKLAHCDVEGTVLVGSNTANVNSMQLRCTDGTDVARNVTATVDHGTLVITTSDRADEQVIVEDFDHFDHDHDNDAFHSRLQHESANGDNDHDNWWVGRCSLKTM